MVVKPVPSVLTENTVPLPKPPPAAVPYKVFPDNNNLAMFNVEAPGKARPLGFIPTGMYPTSVRFNPVDKRIYVANGRGVTPKANPHGPNPLVKKQSVVMKQKKSAEERCHESGDYRSPTLCRSHRRFWIDAGRYYLTRAACHSSSMAWIRAGLKSFGTS